ncbi:MAG: hypothetical protein ACJASV_001547 [Pseudorhodobacter sp.]|jgi:hypothetical protein
MKTAILVQVKRLNALALFDKPAEAITAALALEQQEDRQRQAASNARQAALFDMGASKTASAARRLVARLQLDAPADMFDAIRVLLIEWLVSSRDKGLRFDAAVTIIWPGTANRCPNPRSTRGCIACSGHRLSNAG